MADYNPILDYMYRAYQEYNHDCHRDCHCSCSPPPWLTFNGPVDANCYPLNNLPNPETPCSAATKQYVDRKTSRSGSVQIQQDRNTAQQVVTIAIDNNDAIPTIITALNDIADTGSTGNIGPTGSTRPTRYIGPLGNIEDTGPIGNTGPTGYTGPIGNTFSIGPTASTGPTGSIGSIRPIGSTGGIGPTASTGSIDTGNLRRRLKSFYTRNITNNSF